MHGAIDERQRRRQVVGRAFRVQAAEHLEVGRLARISHVAAHRRARGVNDGDRTRDELLGFKTLVGELSHGNADAPPPQEPPTRDFGMQRAHEHRDAPQRNAATDEAIA